MTHIVENHGASLNMEIGIVNTVVFPVMLYRAEAWTLGRRNNNRGKERFTAVMLATTFMHSNDEKS